MENFITANYHAHTFRCLHAQGTEQEYIEEAIRLGIREFGFSDHIPCPFKDGYVSGIRMTMDEARGYVETVRSLGERYRDYIKLYVGFEAEYIPEFYDEQMLMYYRLNCDYLILGQHFLCSEERGPYMGTKTDDESRIRSYVDTVIAAMEKGSYLYLAHPDLINYCGMDSVYDWEMTRLCRRMKELDIPLELNILGMGSGRNYPSERFWRIPGEIGNRVIVGLDAHSVAGIGDFASYGKCMAIAEKFHLNIINRLDI